MPIISIVESVFGDSVKLLNCIWQPVLPCESIDFVLRIWRVSKRLLNLWNLYFWSGLLQNNKKKAVYSAPKSG